MTDAPPRPVSDEINPGEPICVPGAHRPEDHFAPPSPEAARERVARHLFYMVHDDADEGDWEKYAKEPHAGKPPCHVAGTCCACLCDKFRKRADVVLALSTVQPPAEVWRPIESAPETLAAADLWAIYHDPATDHHHACRLADCYKDRGIWRDRGGNAVAWGPRETGLDGEPDDSYREITHWQPLAAPPRPTPSEPEANAAEYDGAGERVTGGEIDCPHLWLTVSNTFDTFEQCDHCGARRTPTAPEAPVTRAEFNALRATVEDLHDAAIDAGWASFGWLPAKAAPPREPDG